MDIDRLPARHEGVDRRIVDQDNIDIVGLKAGRLDQRFGDIVEKGLGFRIAQDRLGSGGLRDKDRKREDRGDMGD